MLDSNSLTRGIILNSSKAFYNIVKNMLEIFTFITVWKVIVYFFYDTEGHGSIDEKSLPPSMGIDTQNSRVVSALLLLSPITAIRCRADLINHTNWVKKGFLNNVLTETWLAFLGCKLRNFFKYTMKFSNLKWLFNHFFSFLILLDFKRQIVVE